MFLGGYMSKLIPDQYHKNIFDINYDKLKDSSVKCLVFDLDNTLGLIEEERCPKEVRKLIKKLKKKFTVVISSNNFRSRIVPYMEDLGIDGISFSLKPLPRSLAKIRRKYGFNKDEMVMIGDQLVTDILTGKWYGVKTILVDPLGVKDLKITGLNRIVENRIIKKYEDEGVFKKGRYYD